MAWSLSLTDAEQICRSHSLPLTVQRRRVIETLIQRTDHPTADQIYDEVRERLHEMSRTTVYRVLETLVRIGVGRKVCHPGAAARYEILRQRHHHLVCLVCGRMTDFEDPRLDEIPLPEPAGHGYDVTDYTIQFRGTCAKCARKPAGGGRAKKRVKKVSSSKRVRK